VGGAVFTMTSDPAELASMRAWLREALAAHGLPAQPAADVLVAVGELCTNAIVHAYERTPGRPIRVAVAGFDDRVEIAVEDFGVRFDPSHYTPPPLDATGQDIEAVPEHGMGLYLVRELVDAVTHDPARARGNCWTLVKYRSG
jgi:anti-sigma regulatory factor (Ser/Thr protein kinase)